LTVAVSFTFFEVMRKEREKGKVEERAEKKSFALDFTNGSAFGSVLHVTEMNVMEIAQR